MYMSKYHKTQLSGLQTTWRPSHVLYTQSPSALDLLQPIPDPISSTAVTKSVPLTYHGRIILFRDNIGGQTNVSRNRGGYRFELKYINCEHLLKLVGQNHFMGAKMPLQPPKDYVIDKCS